MRTLLRHAANTSVRLVGRLSRSYALPTLFHGRWVRLPQAAWSGVRCNYEPYMARLLVERLRPGDAFADVGAHFGLWSFFAAALVGPRGAVLACEPSPAYDVLASGCYPQVRAVRVGVGSADGQMEFQAQGTSSAGSFVRAVTEINARHLPDTPVSAVRVPVRRLDGLLAEHRVAPVLVKIDVEGYELEVLKGAPELLARRCPLVVEVHPHQLELSGGSEAELNALLAARGYAVRVLHRNPNSLYTVLAE